MLSSWFCSSGVQTWVFTLGWQWFWQDSLGLFPWPQPAIKFHSFLAISFTVFNNALGHILLYRPIQSNVFLWRHSSWGQCLRFVLTPGGFLPAASFPSSLWQISWPTTRLYFQWTYQSLPNAFTILVLILRMPWNFNFSRTYCKLSHLFEREMRSCLFHLVLPQVKGSDLSVSGAGGGNNDLLSVVPHFRSWAVGGKRAVVSGLL